MLGGRECWERDTTAAGTRWERGGVDRWEGVHVTCSAQPDPAAQQT